MKTGDNSEFDVGLAIDQGNWTSFQKLILGMTALAFIVDALANQVMAISIPAMIRDWGVTRADFAPVVAMGWVGVAVGTIIAGSLSDRFGRKTMLLISILTFGAATACCSLVTDIHQLLILRTVDGLGIGGALPTATTLLAEFTPVRRRSRAVNVGMMAIPMGNFICGLVGSVVLPAFGWRTLFAINGLIAICVCVLLLFLLPESPRFLVRRPHRGAELLRGLKKLRIEAPAGALLIDAGARRQGGPLLALFGRDTRFMTLSLWGAFFFCFLASYTSLNWMPLLLSSNGYPLSVASIALSVAGIGGMLGSLMMARLVEVVGSRLAVVLIISVAALCALTLSQMPLDPARSVVPLMFALGVLSMTLNSLTGCIYALAAYLYPPFVKGTGLGAAGSVGRVGAITSSYAGVAMLGLGSQAYFVFIAAAALMSMGLLMTIRQHIPSDRAFAATRSS